MWMAVENDRPMAYVSDTLFFCPFSGLRVPLLSFAELLTVSSNEAQHILI